MRRLSLAVLSVAILVATPGAASAPQSWTVDYADEVVLHSEGAVGAFCVPVGPVLAAAPQPRFGEFVCEVNSAGGPRYPLAIQPNTTTTYTALDPRKPRPAGTVRTGG